LSAFSSFCSEKNGSGPAFVLSHPGGRRMLWEFLWIQGDGFILHIDPFLSPIWIVIFSFFPKISFNLHLMVGHGMAISREVLIIG
jgi:hypothetical protein